MNLLLRLLFLNLTTYGFVIENIVNGSAQIAYKLYKDCNSEEVYSVCLKKKIITALDRLGRIESVPLFTGINLVLNPSVRWNYSVVNSKELDQNLPRAIDAKEDALTLVLMDKLFKYIGSRNIEITFPRYDIKEFVDEARKGDFDFGGGGGKRKGGKKGVKNKKGGMMNMMMMLMGTKLAAFMGLKTIATFLIAKKALIIAKIALILSGMMLFRKFMGGQKGGMGAGAGALPTGLGWDSFTSSKASPHATYGAPNTDGLQSGGWNAGGGYDRRSYDVQDLAYNAYSTTQQ